MKPEYGEMQRERDALAIQLKQMREALEDMHGQFSQQNISKAGLLDWMKHAIALTTTDHEAIIRQHDALVIERCATLFNPRGDVLTSGFAKNLILSLIAVPKKEHNDYY